jgi:hypothetical protein
MSTYCLLMQYTKVENNQMTKSTQSWMLRIKSIERIDSSLELEPTWIMFWYETVCCLDVMNLSLSINPFIARCPTPLFYTLQKPQMNHFCILNTQQGPLWYFHYFYLFIYFNHDWGGDCLYLIKPGQCFRWCQSKWQAPKFWCLSFQIWCPGLSIAQKPCCQCQLS